MTKIDFFFFCSRLFGSWFRKETTYIRDKDSNYTNDVINQNWYFLTTFEAVCLLQENMLLN